MQTTIPLIKLKQRKDRSNHLLKQAMVQKYIGQLRQIDAFLKKIQTEHQTNTYSDISHLKINAYWQ